MKHNHTWSTLIASLLMLSGAFLSSCKKDDPSEIAQNIHREFEPSYSTEATTIRQGESVTITVTGAQATTDPTGIIWALNGKVVARGVSYTFHPSEPGHYTLIFSSADRTLSITREYTVLDPPPFPKFPDPEINKDATPYITKVLEYLPAVGQFVNELPEYEDGDTQEAMNAKALEYLADNQRSLVTLGGWGGYIVVGFDHTILNVPGKRDFRVLGNAFYANDNKDPYDGGSCEPGIIMVAYDANRNGKPDENEWYEIQGSAHVDHTKEPWFDMIKKVPGSDMNFYYRDYEMTYERPTKEEFTDTGVPFVGIVNYVHWTDNRGGKGWLPKNTFHKQTYYPKWIKGDKYTLRGTRLPQNSRDQSGVGRYFVLFKFRYGYVDNEKNNLDDSAIDIDWAIDKYGRKVHLPGVDFIRVHTGINQVNGWLGENSTELSGINDLHVLKEDIPTRK